MTALSRSAPVTIAIIRAATFLCLPTLVVLSLLPANEMERTGLPKVIKHFIAYGGTAGLATLSFGSSLWRTAIIFLGLSALDGALEYAQRWSAGRNSVGILAPQA